MVKSRNNETTVMKSRYNETTIIKSRNNETTIMKSRNNETTIMKSRNNETTIRWRKVVSAMAISLNNEITMWKLNIFSFFSRFHDFNIVVSLFRLSNIIFVSSYVCVVMALTGHRTVNIINKFIFARNVSSYVHYA
jgi:hypothetical protein